MKNLSLFLISAFLLFSNLVYSQYSCQTAFKDQGYNQTALPPVGTVAPIGPDYGCITIFSRPIWGYLMSCEISTITSYTILNANTLVDTYAGIVVWGPFTNKSQACNNLTQNNIVFCEDSILFAGTPLYNCSINTQPGEYYFYMMTSTDTSFSSITITQPMVFQNGFGNPHDCYECNDEISIMYDRHICLVTFDSLSQKTKVIWEKVPDAGIDGYAILRGVVGSSLSDSVGYISETLPGEFIDMDSHPLQFAEMYYLIPYDSCGNSYLYTGNYPPVNAGFLQTYPAGNNTVNLNWNVFGDIVNYEPVQYVRRGSTPQNMQYIDTIPFAVVNYTDIAAPPGQQYYSIEHRKYSACNPLRTSQGTFYSIAETNPSVSTVTGIPVIDDVESLEVGPLPASDILHITYKKGMQGNKLSLVDVNGKVIFTRFITEMQDKIDVSNYAAGIYWICISGNNRIVKKIAIFH